MCCLLYTRDWIDLNKDFHYSGATWAPACSTSTYKNIKTLHYWSVIRRNRCSPIYSLTKGKRFHDVTYHVVSYLTQYLYKFSLVTLVIGYELIESLCHRGFTFKWDRSWVRTTINIMVADVLTWDIYQVTNSLCRIQIYRVFSKHNTYMCRYIAGMYNRSRLVDARPSAIDMLTKRWIYRLNDVSNRVKHVVQVIKKNMFEISRTRHRG